MPDERPHQRYAFAVTEWTPCPSQVKLPTFAAVTTWRGEKFLNGRSVYWAGTDGTLWVSYDNLHGGFYQLSTSRTVTRLAVDSSDADSPTGLFGIDASGKPVKYSNGDWTDLNLGPGTDRHKAVDVAVSTDDKAAWFVTSEGQYYVYSFDGTVIPEELFLGFKAIAPMNVPDPNKPNSVGAAWGVTTGGQLAFNGGGGWLIGEAGNDYMSDLADVSTSLSYAWLLKNDATVWVTQSGYAGQRVGVDFTAKDICGSSQDDHCFAVAADGTPWRTNDSSPM
ncbi:MAG TPA: hypothetical protein VMB04_14430 [Mycobacterium sp.]|nr:hypothetical protein [Mycobacterium sp.]